MWESYLSDKIKRDLFLAIAVFILQYGCTTGALIKHIEKKLDGNETRMLYAVMKEILEATHHKTAAVWPHASHLENYSSKQWQTHKRRFLLDSYTWTHQHSENTRCCQEDLPGTMDDRDG